MPGNNVSSKQRKQEKEETTIEKTLKTLKKRNNKLKRKADTLQIQINILNQAIKTTDSINDNAAHRIEEIERNHTCEQQQRQDANDT